MYVLHHCTSVLEYFLQPINVEKANAFENLLQLTVHRTQNVSSSDDVLQV